MNLSWKLFFITTPIFVLFLTVFGTWIIQDNFQSGLNQEIERCMAENQTFQNSYELTRNSLSNEQWEQMTLKKAVESFHLRCDRDSAVPGQRAGDQFLGEREAGSDEQRRL